MPTLSIQPNASPLTPRVQHPRAARADAGLPLPVGGGDAFVSSQPKATPKQEAKKTTSPWVWVAGAGAALLGLAAVLLRKTKAVTSAFTKEEAEVKAFIEQHYQAACDFVGVQNPPTLQFQKKLASGHAASPDAGGAYTLNQHSITLTLDLSDEKNPYFFFVKDANTKALKWFDASFPLQKVKEKHPSLPRELALEALPLSDKEKEGLQQLVGNDQLVALRPVMTDHKVRALQKLLHELRHVYQEEELQRYLGKEAFLKLHVQGHPNPIEVQSELSVGLQKVLDKAPTKESEAWVKEMHEGQLYSLSKDYRYASPQDTLERDAHLFPHSEAALAWLKARVPAHDFTQPDLLLSKSEKAYLSGAKP